MTQSERLLSLDFFRGITMAAMILVNNQGSWRDAYSAVLHARWGEPPTLTDWIFPFFLFIVGVSIAFAFTRHKDAGVKQSKLIAKILRRTAILFILGLIFYLFPYFEFETMRIPGVLQRIAIVYLFCSIVFIKTSWRTQVIIAVSILLVYWLIMTVVPVPGIGPANVEPDTNLAAWLDFRLLEGHIWYPESDPEGILGTLPSICTGLLGVLTGQWLLKRNSPKVKVMWLLIFGSIFIIVSMIWNLSFPIIKDIWTSSYVLYTAGLALYVLALCYWFIDVREHKRWAKPFVAYGINCISVYFVSHLFAVLIDKVIIIRTAGGESLSLHSWIYNNIFASWLNPPNASLLFSIIFVLFWLVPLWILYKKRIIIKV